MNNNYKQVNSESVDKWVREGWEWGKPVSHETFSKAKKGEWSVLLTPTKPVPKEWFCDFNNASVLGLASGGGQQIPIFTALGAKCTVLDLSKEQIETEKKVADREKYTVNAVVGDMTETLPFDDCLFDLIFHPVSNCYVENIVNIWKECFRVLKKGGILMIGFDNGFNYVVDDDEKTIVRSLPFNPLRDEKLYKESIEKDWGIQFSHTIEEEIGAQLRAGFILTDIFQDTNDYGYLYEKNIPTFYATRAIKP